MPLSSDGVLLEQGGDPLLAFGLPLSCRLPLNFLQHELLVGGLRLVFVVDGAGHVLPQSDTRRERTGQMHLVMNRCSKKKKKRKKERQIDFLKYYLGSSRYFDNSKVTSLIHTPPAPLGERCSG